MAKEQITPEDKLLRLIEAPGQIRSGFFSRKKPAKKAEPKSLWVSLKARKDLFSLASLRKALMVLAGLMTISLIWQVFSSSSALISRNWESHRPAGNKSEVKVVPLLSLSSYLEELAKTNMFSAASPALADAQQQVDSKPQEEVLTLLKNLRLVGIIWSERPQAMIENAGENKTMLLNAGDQIGRLKIKTIYADRVILGLDNQEWELR